MYVAMCHHNFCLSFFCMYSPCNVCSLLAATSLADSLAASIKLFPVPARGLLLAHPITVACIGRIHSKHWPMVTLAATALHYKQCYPVHVNKIHDCVVDINNNSTSISLESPIDGHAALTRQRAKNKGGEAFNFLERRNNSFRRNATSGSSLHNRYWPQACLNFNYNRY